MRAIDEAAQIVRRAVEPRRREQVDAVVAPAELAGELGDRHHLDDRDAESRERRQLLRGRRPRALRREGADVQLVDHLARRRHARASRRRVQGNADGSTTAEGPCGPSGCDREAGSGEADRRRCAASSDRRPTAGRSILRTSLSPPAPAGTPAGDRRRERARGWHTPAPRRGRGRCRRPAARRHRRGGGGRAASSTRYSRWVWRPT